MWVADLGLELLGTRFAVRTDDAVAHAELLRLFEPVLTVRRPVPGRRLYSILQREEGYVAYVDCRSIAESAHLTAVLGAVLTAMNGDAVGATTAFAVHAGVVERHGSAVALAAESGTGKSTLTTALLLQGCGYLSDEALCIDYGTKLVQPYPKPIALAGDSCALLGLPDPLAPEDEAERLLAPSSLGPVQLDPLPLRHVVRLERGTGPPMLTEAPAGDAIAVLLGMSFNHYKRPGDAFQLAAELARSVRVWHLAAGAPFADASSLLAAIG